MWPFNTRLCRCGHARKAHGPEWAWTSCNVPAGCPCGMFRWIRARMWWDMRYRRAEHYGWRRD